ncbi:MAG: ATP-binding protein [Nitrososphaerales archaeon]|nr:ATP-binding protein [Nitrososphaerales archaeon]
MSIDRGVARYFGFSAPSHTVQREITLPKGDFVLAIVGPRRAGKTTYLLQVMERLPVPKSNKVFVNGEDVNFEGMTAKDLDALEESIFRVYSPDTTKDIYLLIDEVQNFPSWARWVRTLHDERAYKIIMTGSTSELNSERLPSALRGRSLNTLVLPFSFKEYLKAKGVNIHEHLAPKNAGTLSSHAVTFIQQGGYPAAVLSEDSASKLKILQELYEGVMQRDIIDKYGVRKRETFRVFMNALLGSACRPLSATSIAGWLAGHGLELTRQAALNYIRFAESVFLVFRLYPYSRKPRERKVAPKVYASDSGLLGLVSADESKKLENQVFIELLRRGEQMHYWRSRQSRREVDFVLGKGGGGELIQVSYDLGDPATYRRETDALLESSQELGISNLTIITMNEEREVHEAGRRMAVVPAWKWLLGFE